MRNEDEPSREKINETKKLSTEESAEPTKMDGDRDVTMADTADSKTDVPAICWPTKEKVLTETINVGAKADEVITAWILFSLV